jgi:dienelactone hydrolase
VDEAQQDRRRRRVVIGMTVLTITLWAIAVALATTVLVLIGQLPTVASWMTETNPAGVGPGIIGHSLGGQVALFALAVDTRLTAGVVSCGLGTLRSFEAARIRHNPAWFVPGLAAAGDVGLVASAVDRPILVAAGTDDALFPLDGVQHVLDAFRPGVVTAELFTGGHAMPPHVTAAAVRHLVSD